MIEGHNNNAVRNNMGQRPGAGARGGGESKTVVVEVTSPFVRMDWVLPPGAPGQERVRKTQRREGEEREEGGRARTPRIVTNAVETERPEAREERERERGQQGLG